MNTRRSRLRSLELTTFKGFKQAKAPLGDFTVVVGTNASGKSNLRDALRFLHGLSRGYTIAETIGEKWIEGGVLQWKDIRGGIREVTFDRALCFGLTVGLELDDAGTTRAGTYVIAVQVNEDGRAAVAEERLAIAGRGEFIFASHPPNNAPTQPDDPHHFAVRIRKEGKKGFLGRILHLLSDRPALGQIADTADNIPKEVKLYCREVREALGSMRFLDLVPEAMRLPSLPGQLVLGDRGENLSSVLLDICDNKQRKSALVKWIRELTPLDVTDFEFTPDQTGRVLVTLVEAGGRKTSAYSASDGTLRFLAMVAAFLGADPARLYFFEELETGLHPTRLHLLLQLIERQARHGASQVVATTHSPQLLAFLDRSTLDSALLAFRREGMPSQELVRLMELPHAREVLESQNISRLHATGWLEDAIAFSSPDPKEASA
ncbi:MAG TPA: AAA family ATPase [Candidatus Nanopelagicales bacterium]|nr:AAA family ATPase [Candidatus Nanopelagicales bacterium]